MSWRAEAPDDVDGPTVGDDRPMLEAYLAFQRNTLLSICAGLDGDQLAMRPVASSQLSLLGLVRHMAKVERIWLRQRAGGKDVRPLHGGAGDPSDFADADASLAIIEMATLHAEWLAADAAVAGVPFDHEFTFSKDGDHVWSVRMAYVHLIGEYARHNGHADLLREAIDGVTGR